MKPLITLTAHSFIRACASCGVDQRLVEAWAGHMSADMPRRYAHLYPSTQQEAMAVGGLVKSFERKAA